MTPLLLVAVLVAGVVDPSAPEFETPRFDTDAGEAPSPASQQAFDAGVDAPFTAPPFVDAPDRPAAEVTSTAPGSVIPAPPAQGFVKGELSVFLGSDRLIAKRNRIGISAGLDRVGTTYYLLVNPQVDLHFLADKLAVGLAVPLRFELVDLGLGPDGKPTLTEHLWRLRREDYDHYTDFAKILQYVTYGRKEDHQYLNVGQRYATTIGHGALVRRYAANIDVDVTRVSAQYDAYNDYGGFELLTNDLLEWNVLSALAFVKPLSFISDSMFAKTLSVGASLALDRNAPLALISNANGVRQLDPETGRMSATRGPVLLGGVDAEMKVLKTAHVDLKPFVDYSMLAGGDGGLTVGGLGRFNLGEGLVHAFRTVVELRSLGARYQPSYFDTFYEVERYVAAELPREVDGIARYATKYADVMSGRRGNRFGYYLEGSYGIRGGVGLTLALEGQSATAEKNAVVHIEVPALNFLQLFGSFYKRGFSDFSELTAIDDRTIFFAGARLRVLPFLFLNGRAYKTFRVNPDLQRYDNTFGFALDLEVGYEFDSRSATAATDPAPAAG